MNERSFSDLEGKYTMCNCGIELIKEKEKPEDYFAQADSSSLCYLVLEQSQKRLMNYFCSGCVVEARKAQASSLFSPALTPTGFS